MSFNSIVSIIRINAICLRVICNRLSLITPKLFELNKILRFCYTLTTGNNGGIHMDEVKELSDREKSFAILEEYLAYMEAIRGRSPLTVKEYRYDLQMFFRFIRRHRGEVSKDLELEQIPIDMINTNYIKTISLTDFYAFLAMLSREREASASTRARKVSTLKGFFGFCHGKRKYIDEDPTAELESPKIPKKQPEYLSLEQSKNLLNQVNPKDDKFAERNYCILTLFLNCGLRLSELHDIDIADISGDKLRVTGKGNKERTIHLNEACIDAIAAYLRVRPANANDMKALFISRQGNRLAKTSIQRMINNYLAKAGIDTKKYSTHKLRHTSATLLYQYGHVDIRMLQQILGHESVATTEIYTHVDDRQLAEAVSLNPLAQETMETRSMDNTQEEN